jgi:phosphatidylglycerophosphate synthase
MTSSVFWFSLFPALVISLIFLAALAAYIIRCAIWGAPTTWRIEHQGANIFLGKWLMEYWMWVIAPVTQFFVRVGITPNTLSWLSLLFGVGSGVAFAFGNFGLGGWAFIFSATFDIFDGMVARQTNYCSDAGDFLDSIIDRYCDFFPLAGMVYYYMGDILLLLPLFTVIGSFMVSYARAKAESYGLELRSGFMQRHERVFYLGLFPAMAPWVSLSMEADSSHPNHWLAVAAIAFVALFSNINGVIRCVIAYRMLALRRAKS